MLYFINVVLFKKEILFTYFLEIGEERERNIYQLVASGTHPD